MNMIKTLQKAARSHTYGEYKIVTRSGAYGCEVYKRYSLADAQRAAQTARESGLTAQIYVLVRGEWQEVTGQSERDVAALRQIEVDHEIKPWKE